MIFTLSGRRCVPQSDRVVFAASHRPQLAAMNLPRTSESLLKIPPFNPTGVQLSDVHKTGLGSSAALITSIVSALLLHLQVVPPSAFSQDGREGRRLAHNLAQFVHCFAQGKVGSGFDVSSAVFGSQLYTRFDPTVLDPIMSEDVVSLGYDCDYTGKFLFFSNLRSDQQVGIAAHPVAHQHELELHCGAVPAPTPNSINAGGC
jgi:hypothetical protein